MVESRELTPEEKRQGYTSIVYVRPGDPSVGRGGVEVVDIETGERTGNISRIEFSRMQRGERKWKGELFVSVPARPEIVAKIERREEKQETAELARKEAEFEAKRIREGKIKPEDVVLTQPGAAKELKKILEKEVKEPVVDEREQERQERILATLEKQRQFAALTESQQRVVRTLVKQGREVSFEDGAIITEEAGRKVVISAAAIAKVPVTAEVDVKELERMTRKLRARERVEVREIKEPVFLGPKPITPEELIAQVQRERLEEKGFIRRAAEPTKEFVSRTLRGFKKSVEYAGKPIKTPQESAAIIRDPDVQVFLLVSGLTLVGGAFPVAAKVITTARRVFGAIAVKEFLEEGKPEKFGEAVLLLSPEIISGIKRVVPKPEIARGVIGDIKTTIIRFRGRGAGRALGVRVGRRAVFVGVGEPALVPPRAIIPVTPTAIVPVPPIGIVPPPIIGIPPTIVSARELIRVREREIITRAREQTIQDVVSGIIDIKDVSPSIRKEAAKRIRQEALAKRGISPLDIRPVGIFAPTIPKPPPIEIIKRPSVKELRKIRRKEILERRGIAPLDITPKGIFAPTVPLYEPPAVARVRARETIQRAREQTIEDVLEGRISISEVRPSIRREVRKRLVSEVRTREEFLRAIGKLPEKPRELFFDIERLPIPTFQIFKPKVKVKPPRPREIVKPRPPREVITREGQVLILRPPITERIKVSKQEQVAIAKLEKKTLTAAQRQALAQSQAQRQRVTLGQLVGTESIQRGKLAFALGIIPARRVGVRPISIVDVAQARKITAAQRQAQAQRQAMGEVSISGLESIQVGALTQVQIQAQAETQASAVEQALKQVQKEQLIEKVPSPLGLQFLFKTSEEEKVKLIKPIGFGEEGYNVYVKRKQLKKGKGSYRSRGFKKANVEPISREAALGLGASAVDTFTNRSFFVEKAKQKIKRRRQDLINRWRALSHKFRASKKKPDVLVEESTYAIDHPVEVAGIPYEAARLRKAGLLQQKITFIKSQQKKQQLQSAIATKQQQISFISSPKEGKREKVKPIKFL